MPLFADDPPASRPDPKNAPDREVRPSATDRAIRTFDNPHGIYLPGGDKPRGELLLFLPGTNPRPRQAPAARRFCRTASACGYHAVYLMYPNDVSAAQVARGGATDVDAFSEFRRALVEGADTPYAKVPRAESIENRAVKLLRFLERERPREGWGAFLDADGAAVRWEKVAVAGQSQGGGHAAWIATRRRVARVLCFGSPKDYDTARRAPARWYDARPSATPPARFFAFNNVYDRQGCNYDRQVENLKALGVYRLGAADVDREKPPYGRARALFTRWPGRAGGTDSRDAHTSVIRDNVTAPDGSPLFAPVWRYMLTEPAESARG